MPFSHSNVVLSTFVDVIELKRLDFAHLIAGYDVVYVPVLSRDVTLSCDSSSSWLLILNQNSSIIQFDSNSDEVVTNETFIQVIDGVLYFDSFGVFESGYYTCMPNTPIQSTLYLQSIG